MRPRPGMTRSKTNRPSGPLVAWCCVKIVRSIPAERVQASDVNSDRYIRGRRLADPKRPFHPRPRLQMDDSR